MFNSKFMKPLPPKTECVSSTDLRPAQEKSVMDCLYHQNMSVNLTAVVNCVRLNFPKKLDPPSYCYEDYLRRVVLATLKRLEEKGKIISTINPDDHRRYYSIPVNM